MRCISRAFPLSRLVAVCLSVLMAGPMPLAATAQQAAQPLPDAPAPANGAAQNSPGSRAPSLRLVSGARVGTNAAAPSASVAQPETAMSQPPAVAVPEGWSSSLAQQAPVQDADQQQQNQPQKPVGTAVGPVTRPTGIAGARPAGAAIAAAKQRRVHAIFIRVAIIVAAAAATGAVIGLSKQSPSRPQ